VRHDGDVPTAVIDDYLLDVVNVARIANGQEETTIEAQKALMAENPTFTKVDVIDGVERSQEDGGIEALMASLGLDG